MGPGTTRSTASAAVEAVLGSILTLTAQGERLHITRFGTFQRRECPPRRAYHIPAGQVQQLPAQRKLAFTPAQDFPNRV